MMPLGITPPQRELYHERLLLPHDFAVEVDVLHLDEKARGRLTGVFIDGQVNLQRAAGGVARTATFTLYDPDHDLHLDADGPAEGALFFDRIVRVRHIVEMPWGPVTAIPFCGPMTKIGREGDLLNLECQDKAILAMEGRPPMTRQKGTNAVRAIKDFMEATGERRFRFSIPNDRLKRKRLHKNYSVGWTRSPWSVCQQIAKDELDLDLVYSCDGALLLRRPAKNPVVIFAESDLTSGVKIDYDASRVRNYVRVQGEIPAKKGSGQKRPQKFAEWAVAKASHPMSPTRLGRNGEKRWLPLVIEDSSIKKHSVAKDKAERELAKLLPLQVTSSWSTLPFFHLDSGDWLRLNTAAGTVNTPLVEASLPLGLGGDAALGIQRKVSKPRRTGMRAVK